MKGVLTELIKDNVVTNKKTGCDSFYCTKEAEEERTYNPEIQIPVALFH